MAQEVQGFLLQTKGSTEPTFLPTVPLRVLFGRSGAGKSTILDGIAAAVSGYPSLAGGRSARGMAGVLLKDSEHVQVLGMLDTVLDALKRKKSELEKEALIEEVDAALDHFEAEKVLEDEWIGRASCRERV